MDVPENVVPVLVNAVNEEVSVVVCLLVQKPHCASQAPAKLHVGQNTVAQTSLGQSTPIVAPAHVRLQNSSAKRFSEAHSVCVEAVVKLVSVTVVPDVTDEVVRLVVPDDCVSLRVDDSVVVEVTPVEVWVVVELV